MTLFDYRDFCMDGNPVIFAELGRSNAKPTFVRVKDKLAKKIDQNELSFLGVCSYFKLLFILKLENCLGYNLAIE